MNKLGELIRNKREQNNLLLRHLAAQLDIDTALLSKMERGERIVKRELVLKLSEIFKIPAGQLITLWLADKLFEIVKSEPDAINALEITKNELIRLKSAR